MKKDTLFLLKGDFMKGMEGPFYCPECVSIEGVLSYFPALREQLDVVYVDFERPRQVLIDALGEAHQGCPALVVGDPLAASGDFPFKSIGETRFLDDEKAILRYLGLTYKVSLPAH